MLLRFLLVLCLVLPHAATAAALLVYGDSLSAGYGVPRGEGWVSLLEARLHDEKPDYKVANASLSGETTAGARARLAAVLSQYRPQIVILELGANDGLRGQSLDAMRANLDAMITACHHAGAKVLLVGMRLPPNYGPAYTEKFHRVYVDLARQRKVPLVPFLLDGFAEDRSYFQADAIHPTAQAQRLILETVWKQLEPLLKIPARVPLKKGEYPYTPSVAENGYSKRVARRRKRGDSNDDSRVLSAPRWTARLQ